MELFNKLFSLFHKQEDMVTLLRNLGNKDEKKREKAFQKLKKTAGLEIIPYFVAIIGNRMAETEWEEMKKARSA